MSKERSRANPSVVLYEAVDSIRAIHAKHGTEEVTRDEIARVFRYSSAKSGLAARRLAALGHLRFLDKRGQKFAVSALALKILERESNGDDATEELRQAFFSVPVFREYIESCRGLERLPDGIADQLVDFGITEATKEEVAANLVESALQARIIGPDRRFLLWANEAADRTKGPPVRIELPLADGRQGTLVLPSGLRKRDIEILRAQLSVLEMSFSDAEPAGALPFQKRRLGRA